ncbi:MAG: enoyl-[acyl-carrier-protein] reductase FabL [Dehalococcoidales bacterium]|nr:MAG: enoyl-[acyl-carrier-protein] reductase FabL [Dehalococcoidales bacterium]
MPLKGKVALITGGSRGIGRAITLRLASEGADVVINFFRKRDTAEGTAGEARNIGVTAHIIKANLAEPEKIDRMFTEIEERFGRLDILVNNAASGVARPAMELNSDAWDWTMSINARAALLCAQRAARLMTNGGVIVNISSLGSRLVLPIYTAVGVSKAALEALTRYLAIEMAPQGIRVNAVSAAAVETETMKLYTSDPNIPQSMVTKTPAGPMVQPEDIANTVAFLCRDEAAMIRGQIIVIDGGLSLTSLSYTPDEGKGGQDAST